MNYIEQAIREAVEKGGYMPPTAVDSDEIPAAIRYFAKSPYRVFLDPTFWQALGKARGWGAEAWGWGGETWVMEWHRFIDALAEGKDAESFFKNLLPASTHLPSGDA